MKIFFDRLSDFITRYKPIGRALAGRKAYVLATGAGEILPEGFHVPFQSAFGYFNISYGGIAYVSTGDDPQLKIQSLGNTKTSFNVWLNGGVYA